MNNKMFFPEPMRPISPNTKNIPKHKISNNVSGDKFSNILNDKINGEVKFSKHALERLRDRNIKLSAEKLEKLNMAVDKVKQKGSKESLVLMDQLAFVVSVKNNTVITALDGQNAKENVFTNIDSAIII